MTPHMKTRQSWLTTGKPPKEKKNRKPLPKAKKRVAYFSNKRQRANRQYAKASKPKWQGLLCAIRAPGCTNWAEGWNHADGKESEEKLLDVDNGQAACNWCNGYCESHHTWAVENGFRGKRNRKTKRYDHTYNPEDHANTPPAG